MALTGYVSDLEVGDSLAPVEYEMSPFVVREYCHGVGEYDEDFHSGDGEPGIQLAPPTLIHIDKIRLIKRNCPLGPGPNARIHFEYHATHHAAIPVGEKLVASGRVSRRYEKRGRTYLEMEIELKRAAEGQLLISYLDTAVLSFSRD